MRRRLAIAAPSALLCLIAAAQMFLARTADLSPWKGGGFGMFASTDGTAFRWVRLYVFSTARSEEIAVPASLEDRARRVAVWPHRRALEDLAFFRAVPECVVFYPGDAVATDVAVQLAAQRKGMVYIRTTRGKTPAIYDPDTAFTVGGLKILRQHDDDRLAIVAAGITLHEALAAHDELAGAGIAVRVIDLYCVKPVDAAALLEAGRACPHGLLTVEDHYAEGGIGAAVLEAVGDAGITVHRLAVREIPRSGPPRKLLERYGIGRGAIVTKVREIV